MIFPILLVCWGILIACRNNNVGSVCAAQLNGGVCSGSAPDLHSEDAWFDAQAILTYVFFNVYSNIYSVIQKDGLNFVSLYFKIRTSDKYDVNYIWLYSQ